MEMWAWDNATDGLRIIFVACILGFFAVAGLMTLFDYIKSKRKPKV